MHPDQTIHHSKASISGDRLTLCCSETPGVGALKLWNIRSGQSHRARARGNSETTKTIFICKLKASSETKQNQPSFSVNYCQVNCTHAFIKSRQEELMSTNRHDRTFRDCRVLKSVCWRFWAPQNLSFDGFFGYEIEKRSVRRGVFSGLVFFFIHVLYWITHETVLAGHRDRKHYRNTPYQSFNIFSAKAS